MVVKVFQSAACIMQNEQSPHSFSKLRKAKHNQSEGVICLFKHEKQLFHPVEVEQPNPQYAALLQEQLGGGNGELKAAMQYMSQSFRIRNPKIKDLFMDIAAEELSHMEPKPSICSTVMTWRQTRSRQARSKHMFCLV